LDVHELMDAANAVLVAYGLMVDLEKPHLALFDLYQRRADGSFVPVLRPHSRDLDAEAMQPACFPAETPPEAIVRWALAAGVIPPKPLH
jgi:hypothetical protein